MRAHHAAALLVVLTVAPLAGQQSNVSQDPVVVARHLYNEGRYDAAISAAGDAVGMTGLADQAQLVIGRARLERFRQTTDRQDLEAGRAALRGVNPGRLARREQVELIVGFAEALYLEESYGAAVEMFESVLSRIHDLDPGVREQVLDWWATALDRQAQARRSDARDALYRRLLTRMDEELQRNPASGAASYWIAAAARGLGDLERAWHAAIAGWVRAPLTSDRGAALRADLDRLVCHAIIPDRARRHRDGAASLHVEWETVKQNWTNK
jgi:hypothetical protein